MKCWVTSFPLIEYVHLSYQRVCIARGVQNRCRRERAERRGDLAPVGSELLACRTQGDVRLVSGGCWGMAVVSRRRFLRHSRASFWRRIVWYPGFGGFTRFYRIDAVVPRSLMHRRCQMPLAQPWSFSEKLL